MKTIIVILSVLTFTLVNTNAYSQPGLSPDIRNGIYRTINSYNQTGTAILFKHLNEYFLITNKHLLYNDSDSLASFIHLYKNITTINGEVISTKEYWTINPANYTFPPKTEDLDLRLVSISINNCDFLDKDVIMYFPSEAINTEDEIDFNLQQNPILTAIGFPAKGSSIDIETKYAEYRWGRYLGKSGHGIVHNIPVIGGSSGSAIIAKYDNNYKLVAIHTSTNTKTKLKNAISAHRIKKDFPEFFERVDKLNQSNDSFGIQSDDSIEAQKK